jgi:hypothetical protein
MAQNFDMSAVGPQKNGVGQAKYSSETSVDCQRVTQRCSTEHGSLQIGRLAK